MKIIAKEPVYAMKILLCDNERDILNSTREKIEKTLNELMSDEKNIVLGFENFFSLLDYIEGRDLSADGIFMNINLMENLETNGVDIIAKIKETKNIHIFFYAGSIEYDEDIFMAEPFDFAVKPVYNEKLKNILIGLKNTIDSEAGKIIVIKAINGIYRVMLDEIDYAESNGRYVYMYTRREKIITIDRLDNVLNKLGNGFARCHKSFIVNWNKIRYYNGDRIVLFDQREIPVSKKWRHDIKNVILNNI